jgi:pimeloyl-ACP methyl ester carboxylesterase
MAALGLAGGALFRRIFSRQCPQLDSAQLDRFTRSFAMNPDARQTTLRQFRQIMQPGFFDGFASMWRRIHDAAPCRVLWGDQDRFIGVQYANSFGAAKVTILPEAGHWVALTAPDALAAEVEAVGAMRASR